jgi:polysaccharide biosynthesis transport protein
MPVTTQFTMSDVPGAPKRSQQHEINDIMQDETNERLLPPALLQYWHTMLRWRFVLLGIIGVSLIIGLISTMLMAPLYTAKAELQISRQQKKVTNVAGVDAEVNGQDLEFYSTQYALLKSTSLAERVGKNLKLSSNKAFFDAMGKKMPEHPDVANRQVTSLLLRNIAIDPIRNSRLVDVSYTSGAADLSAQIVNTWTREFMGANMDREFSSTADARQFLEQRLSVLRAKLEESEHQAATFASQNDIIALETSRSADGKSSTQKTMTSSDLEQLNQALMVARADRISAESRAKSGNPEASLDALNNTTISNLREKRAEIAGEYAKILSQFDPRYPKARALKSQIDELDMAIAKNTARIGTGRTLAFTEAIAREHDLEQRVAQLKTKFDLQNRATIQYNIFQRDADTNRQLYDALLQRYKEIGVAGAVGTNNIVVVDEAKAPMIPSSPKLAVNMPLALLIGIGLAAIAVLALEQIDEGIRSPADVWTLLKLPLLGNVPKVDRDVLESLQDPKSNISEAYFSIRSNLAFSTNHGLPRSIAVTSSQASEGKSTTAFALAEVIGKTGKSVLLLDADMRSPSIHSLAGGDNKAGLANLLAGDDNILSFVQTSQHRGLSFIPAGPLPPSPAELLSSERLSFVIVKLLDSFDHVIVDSPPVLGLADAPLICKAVEGSIFVAEPGRSPLRGIRAALNRLKFVGSHIFGVIVTKIDINSQHYGYSYGYGYGYGRYGYGYGYAYGSNKDDEA